MFFPIAHRPSPIFNKGFTLIELIMVIVLIGIVAATAVMVIGNIITQQQFDATVKEMNELKMANLGNPDMVQGGTRTSFGFVGDIGGLPAGNSLQPLVVQGGLPGWTTTAAYHAATYPAEPAMPDLGTGAGWRGPYIDNKRDDAGTYLATLDGWGTAYTYVTATGIVTSTGGGAGNIVIPETSVATQLTGGVAGTVRGNQGNPVEGATVRIYYPNPASLGNHTTCNTTTDSSGVYILNGTTCPTNIPIGRRTIRVISGTSPNWAIVNDTVVVDGNQTQTVTKNITIADMVAPAAPTWANVTGNCTVNGVYPIKTNQINLQWTASTSPDVASYKIYRGTTLGGEVLYLSGITGTSYTNTPVTTNTTYYYKMSAVDTAGNESALTANPTGGSPAGSRIAGPIYKSAISWWLANDEIRIPTTNSGISNITMTNNVYQMIVNWTSTPASTIRRVRVGGTTVYNEPGAGCLGAASGIPLTINAGSYTYTCNTNRNVDIRFCDNIWLTTTDLNVQLGGGAAPFDGQLTGLPLATWP